MARPHSITSVVTVHEGQTGTSVGVDCPTKVHISRIRIQGAKRGAFNVTVFDRSFKPVPVPVVSITDDGDGKCLVQFAANPDLEAGDSFIVSGNTVSAYNTTHAVTAWVSPTQVVTDQSFTAVGYGMGATGQLDIAVIGPGFDGKTLVQFDIPHNLGLYDTFIVSGCSAYNTTHTVTRVVDTHTVLTDQAWTVNAGGGQGALNIPFSASDGDAGYLYEFLPKQATSADNIWRFDSDYGLTYVNQDPEVHNMPVRKMYFLFDVADTYTITITSFSSWYG